MSPKDRLPIAMVAEKRNLLAAVVYFGCATVLVGAAYAVADQLNPLSWVGILAAILVGFGLVVFVRKPHRMKAYAQWRDVMPCHISVQDPRLKIIDANDLFKRDFGDRQGDYCFKVYKGLDTPCTDCPVLATFEDGQVHSSQETVTLKDGTSADMVVTSAPLLNDRGNVVAAVEMATNVTELNTLKQKLDESRRDFKRLFEAVPCYICLLDHDLTIVESNALYRRDFDVAPGTHCYEACKKRSSSCPGCLVEQTFNDGEPHSSEETLTTRDGQKLNLVVNSMPVTDESGQIRTVMEVFTDITEVKRLQRQLTLMGRAVAGMAHRIKNILMGLEGGIFVVNTGMESDDQALLNEGWEMVERNVDRVSRLVMDLLYCSKEREPKFEDDVSPQAIAEEIAELYRGRMAAAEIELDLELGEPRRPGRYDADALHNMLSNLVANAIDACRFDLDPLKTTHRVRLMCATERPDQTVFEVEDNGAGIPKEVEEKVFEDFFSTKGTEGTGVGLLVVQKAAEEHDGHVSFETEPGKGTKFTVTIPTARIN